MKREIRAAKNIQERGRSRGLSHPADRAAMALRKLLTRFSVCSTRDKHTLHHMVGHLTEKGPQIMVVKVGLHEVDIQRAMRNELGMQSERLISASMHVELPRGNGSTLMFIQPPMEGIRIRIPPAT